MYGLLAPIALWFFGGYVAERFFGEKKFRKLCGVALVFILVEAAFINPSPSSFFSFFAVRTPSLSAGFILGFFLRVRSKRNSASITQSSV